MWTYLSSLDLNPSRDLLLPFSTVSVVVAIVSGHLKMLPIYVPTPVEEAYALYLLRSVFRRDYSETQFQLDGMNAVPFFMLSGQDRLILKHIWTVADPTNVGTLTDIVQFHICLRLIALSQCGILGKALAEAFHKYGSDTSPVMSMVACMKTTAQTSDVPLPKFVGIDMPQGPVLQLIYTESRRGDVPGRSSSGESHLQMFQSYDGSRATRDSDRTVHTSNVSHSEENNSNQRLSDRFSIGTMGATTMSQSKTLSAQSSNLYGDFIGQQQASPVAGTIEQQHTENEDDFGDFATSEPTGWDALDALAESQDAHLPAWGELAPSETDERETEPSCSVETTTPLFQSDELATGSSQDQPILGQQQNNDTFLYTDALAKSSLASQIGANHDSETNVTLDNEDDACGEFVDHDLSEQPTLIQQPNLLKAPSGWDALDELTETTNQQQLPEILIHMQDKEVAPFNTLENASELVGKAGGCIVHTLGDAFAVEKGESIKLSVLAVDTASDTLGPLEQDIGRIGATGHNMGAEIERTTSVPLGHTMITSAESESTLNSIERSSSEPLASSGWGAFDALAPAMNAPLPVLQNLCDHANGTDTGTEDKGELAEIADCMDDFPNVDPPNLLVAHSAANPVSDVVPKATFTVNDVSPCHLDSVFVSLPVLESNIGVHETEKADLSIQPLQSINAFQPQGLLPNNEDDDPFCAFDSVAAPEPTLSPLQSFCTDSPTTVEMTSNNATSEDDDFGDFIDYEVNDGSELAETRNNEGEVDLSGISRSDEIKTHPCTIDNVPLFGTGNQEISTQMNATTAFVASIPSFDANRPIEALHCVELKTMELSSGFADATELGVPIEDLHTLESPSTNDSFGEFDEAVPEINNNPDVASEEDLSRAESETSQAETTSPLNNDFDASFGDFAEFQDAGGPSAELHHIRDSATEAIDIRSRLVTTSYKLPEAFHDRDGIVSEHVIFGDCFDGNIGTDQPLDSEQLDRIHRCIQVMELLSSSHSKLVSTYWNQSLIIIHEELQTGQLLMEQASGQPAHTLTSLEKQLEVYVHALGEMVRVSRSIIATVGDLLLLHPMALLTVDTLSSSWCQLSLAKKALEIEALWSDINKRSDALTLVSKQQFPHRLESLTEMRSQAPGPDTSFCHFTLRRTREHTESPVQWHGQIFLAVAANFLAHKCPFYTVVM